MANETQLALRQEFTLETVERLGKHIAAGGLFGVKDPSQAISLMMLAHSEGLHPMKALQKFHIIEGRPSKKAEAMLEDFLAGGGKYKILHYGDDYCEMSFSYDGNEVTVRWDEARYIKAKGITNRPADGKEPARTAKQVWDELYDANKYIAKKFPAAMWRSRCISEGIKTVSGSKFSSGMYTPEEQADIPLKNVTPVQVHEIDRNDLADFNIASPESGESDRPANPSAETEAVVLKNSRQELRALYESLPIEDKNPDGFKLITGLDTFKGLDIVQCRNAIDALREYFRRRHEILYNNYEQKILDHKYEQEGGAN